MIGRRAIAGFAVLCALVFSAFASQSASAETPETTAFECTTKAAALDFSDAHCDVTKSPGTFGHTKFSTVSETAISATNEKTASSTTAAVSSSIEGEVALTKTKINCTKFQGSGKLKNEEPAAGKMQAKGNATVEFSGCTVEKPLKCVVAEPITVKTTAITKTNLGVSKTEMGVEFAPEVGVTFVTIEYLNKGAEACGLNKQNSMLKARPLGQVLSDSAEALETPSSSRLCV
jgi:hypothetical protein